MNIITEDNFIGVYDNVLSQEQCDYIISEFERIQDQNLSTTYVGDLQFKDRELGRQDTAIFANHGHNQICQIINDALSNVITQYSSEYWILKQIKAHSVDVKIQKTPPRGGYHVWHSENASMLVSNRIVTWMFYLNDIPDGEGETEFLWQKLRINPKAGRAVMWPAAFTHTHRGNPVYSCNKYVATGWYHMVE